MAEGKRRAALGEGCSWKDSSWRWENRCATDSKQVLVKWLSIPRGRQAQKQTLLGESQAHDQVEHTHLTSPAPAVRTEWTPLEKAGK